MGINDVAKAFEKLMLQVGMVVPQGFELKIFRYSESSSTKAIKSVTEPSRNKYIMGGRQSSMDRDSPNMVESRAATPSQNRKQSFVQEQPQAMSNQEEADDLALEEIQEAQPRRGNGRVTGHLDGAFSSSLPSLKTKSRRR